MSRDIQTLTRKLLRVKCSKCKTRQKRYSDETHNFSCKKCNGEKFYIVQDKVCNCDGYEFPHRMGSRYCGFDTDGNCKIIEDDVLEERYQGLYKRL